jgi:hypothetical protein
MLRLTIGGAIATAVGGCSSPARLSAIPRGRQESATVFGQANERYYPTLPSQGAALEREFQASFQRITRGSQGVSRARLPAYQALSISGGGENGAFGAGLLCGWSEQGTRPVFQLVTGVSTGALSAPFAFLGSSYDPQLRAVYTDIKPSDVLLARGLLPAVLFEDALADNSPLFKTISRYLNEEMMTAIARGYDEGRMLLIGTSDLDAQLPVIWNIGAIAKSGHARALDTVRRILLASAAVPGAFPPVMFDVTLDGKPYQEMHVDGGAFAQAFLYPSAVTRDRRERLRRGLPTAQVHAYIIRNARLDAEWAEVDRRTMGIAGRAISTMIAASGYNDVLRMYAASQRDGVDFNLASIGTDFNETLKEPFEPTFMRALFDYGYQKGRRGYQWHKQPPVV